MVREAGHTLQRSIDLDQHFWRVRGLSAVSNYYELVCKEVD
jgi:hypothetical protein